MSWCSSRASSIGTGSTARSRRSTATEAGRAANPRRVFISGQKRGVFDVIKRELRRRCAIEAVIGHMNTDGHLGRCYLKGREGDAANVITRPGLLRALCRLIVLALVQAFVTRSALR